MAVAFNDPASGETGQPADEGPIGAAPARSNRVFTVAGKSRAWGRCPGRRSRRRPTQRSEPRRGRNAADLARRPNILEEFASELSRIGVVGERRAAKLIYLAAHLRLLDRPVSVAVKGPSSGGKSFVVESTLKFFPPEAFYSLTAMSDRALAYSSEPLRHRHLVIYEAAGMASDFATYLIRSLLSEGRLRYETVEKTKDGLVPRLIEREGPTGLIVTTTSLRLHPENETRMLSLTITDTQRPDGSGIPGARDKRSHRVEIDLSQWHALQTWLATGPTRVVIPFADQTGATGAAGRGTASAGLQNSPDADPRPRLAASGLPPEGRDGPGRSPPSKTTRRCVSWSPILWRKASMQPSSPRSARSWRRPCACLRKGVTRCVRQTSRSALKLDKSAISRRVAAALDGGFLKNLEDRKGRPARLVLGDPLPCQPRSPSAAEPARSEATRCTIARKTARIGGGIPLCTIRRERKAWSAPRSPGKRQALGA